MHAVCMALSSAAVCRRTGEGAAAGLHLWGAGTPSMRIPRGGLVWLSGWLAELTGHVRRVVQEIKEAVELPLTHPELYEDIGIKPPKVRERFQKFWAPPDEGSLLMSSAWQCGLRSAARHVGRCLPAHRRRRLGGAAGAGRELPPEQQGIFC